MRYICRTCVSTVLLDRYKASLMYGWLRPCSSSSPVQARIGYNATMNRNARLIIGYSFFVAANSFTLREPTLMFSADLLSHEWLRAATYLPFALATIAMCFFVLRSKKDASRSLLVASVASFLVGAALLVASWALSGELFVSVLSMIVLACYCAILFTAWVNEAVRLEKNDLWIYLISSSILAALIHFLCVAFIGDASAAPAFLVLSVLSLGLLLGVSKSENAIAPTHPSWGTDLRFVWQIISEKGLLILYLGALGFVSSVSRMVLWEEGIVLLSSVEMVSVVLAGVVLFFALFVIRARVNAEETILCLIPIVGLFCLGIPLASDPLHLAAFGASTTAFTTGLLLLQVVCRDYGRGDARKAVAAYCLLAGFVCVLNVLGFYALDALNSESGLSEYMASVFICLFVLLLALLVDRLPFSKTRFEEAEAETASENAAIANLAQEYGLTEREVLELMANGRNIPAIAKILYVSESTVRTHNKHIFKKMNVHTRQECLDLVAASGTGVKR